MIEDDSDAEESKDAEAGDGENAIPISRVAMWSRSKDGKEDEGVCVGGFV